MAEAIFTVIFTLLVTYFANTASQAFKQQRLYISAYNLLKILLLNESRALRIGLSNAAENSEHIQCYFPPALYNASIYEMLLICDISDEVFFMILDSCDRHNIVKLHQPMTKEDANDRLKVLQSDLKVIEEKLADARRRTWLFYWISDFKKFLTFRTRLKSN